MTMLVFSLLLLPLIAAILPLALVAYGRHWILTRSSGGEVSRRWLLFLLAAFALMLLPISLLSLNSRYTFNTEGSPLLMSLTLGLLPGLVGVTALLLIALAGDWRFSPGRLRSALASASSLTPVGALLLSALILTLLAMLWRYGFTQIILIAGTIFALGWSLGHERGGLLVASSLLVLAVQVLVFRGSINIVELAPPADALLRSAFILAVITLMALSYLLPALLFYHAYRDGQVPPYQRRLLFALASLLVLAAAYGIYWDAFWASARARAYEDNMPFVQFLLVLMSCALLAVFLPGRRRWIGLAYTVLVPVCLFLAFHWGWNTSPLRLTQARGAKITAALEKDNERSGRYPESLEALAPGLLLRIAPPIGNLQGERWCYEVAPGAYRLGYVLGEFTYIDLQPKLSVQVFSQAGGLSGPFTACDQQLQEIRSRKIQ